MFASLAALLCLITLCVSHIYNTMASRYLPGTQLAKNNDLSVTLSVNKTMLSSRIRGFLKLNMLYFTNEENFTYYMKERNINGGMLHLLS